MTSLQTQAPANSLLQKQLSENSSQEQQPTVRKWVIETEQDALNEACMLEDVELPHHFMCPISHQLMQDPVILNDGSGMSFDRAQIQQAFDHGNFRNPLTGASLTEQQQQLIPNRNLKHAIEEFKQQYLSTREQDPKVSEDALDGKGDKEDSNPAAERLFHPDCIQLGQKSGPSTSAAGAHNLAWAPNGAQLAVADLQSSVRIWDLESQSSLQAVDCGPWTNCVAWSPAGNLVAYDVGQAVEIWDLQSGASLWQKIRKAHISELTGLTGDVTHLSWSRDGSLLAAAAVGPSGMEVIVWNASDHSKVAVLHEGRRGGTEGCSKYPCISWGPESFLAMALPDRLSVIVFDCAACDQIAELTMPPNFGWVNTISWCVDGSGVLAVGMGEFDHSSSWSDGAVKGKIVLLDLHNGEHLQVLEGHADIVHALDWSPDGVLLASGSKDSKVRVWEALTGRLVQGLEGSFTMPLTRMAWSPTGDCLAAVGLDQVFVWKHA